MLISFVPEYYSTRKSYFISNNLKVEVERANEVCESFDMDLASPQNQKEYDFIQKALGTFKSTWNDIRIGIYRSETNSKEWVTSTNKVDFKIDWAPNEPNGETSEHNAGKL